MPTGVYGGVVDEISPCVYVVIGQGKEVGDCDVVVDLENNGLNAHCETMFLVEVDYLSVQ